MVKLHRGGMAKRRLSRRAAMLKSACPLGRARKAQE